MQSHLPAFGSRLRQVRRAHGVKQSALSRDLGVAQSSVSRWEGGGQTPSARMQRRAFDLLSTAGTNDTALKRLVETSTALLHLIDDATHKCLAFSPSRAQHWGKGDHAQLIGTSLWRFATGEIEHAESQLDAAGWWESQHPQAQKFHTGAISHQELHIQSGQIIWERLYLADGTPVRLCTALAQKTTMPA